MGVVGGEGGCFPLSLFSSHASFPPPSPQTHNLSEKDLEDLVFPQNNGRQQRNSEGQREFYKTIGVCLCLCLCVSSSLSLSV